MAANGSDTFTAEELREALERYCPDSAETIPQMALNLIADIKAHREPEYEDGSYYLGSDDIVWQYDEQNHAWYSFVDNALHVFNDPGRPLRKLVPEIEV
jgi:hypothetical protein